MEFDGLQALLAVAQHGSLQAAARSTGTSRSTLRRRIEALEAALDIDLVHRGGKGARLTRAGERLVDSGRRIMADTRRAMAEVAALKAEPEGVIRIVAPAGAPVELKIRALQATWAFQPNIRVALTETEASLDHLDEPFDLMLYYGPPPTRGEHYTRSLRKLPIGLMATNRYLARHGRPETLADLADHPLLAFEPALEACGAALGEAARRPRLVTANDHLVRTLAAEGAGIALSLRPPLPFDPLARDGVLVLPDAIDATLVATLLMPTPTRTEPLVQSLLGQLLDIVNFD